MPPFKSKLGNDNVYIHFTINPQKPRLATMAHIKKINITPLSLGFIISICCFGLSILIAELEYPSENGLQLALILQWPSVLLEKLIVCSPNSSGSCQATSLEIILCFAGIPLGALVYGLLIYLVFRYRRSHA
jgi:hypothetical protein